MGDLNRRTYYKKWWFWGIGVLVMLGLFIDNLNSPSVISRALATAVISNTSLENSYKAGKYTVGTDIKAGEYVVISDGGTISTTETSNGYGYLIKSKRSIQNRLLVTLCDGQVVTIENAVLYPIYKAPSMIVVDGKAPAGMYKGGYDLVPGTYTIVAYDSKSSCKVQYYKDSTYRYKTDISNYTFWGEKKFAISSGEYMEITNGYIAAK